MGIVNAIRDAWADTVSTLKRQDEAEADSAIERYRRLVVAKADGKAPPKPDELRTILSEAEKSLEDLESDAAALIERREQRRQLDDEEAVDAELTSKLEERESDRAAFIAYRNAHIQRQAALDQEIAGLYSRKNTFDRIRVRLSETSPFYAPLCDAIQVVGKHSRRIEVLTAERKKLEGFLLSVSRELGDFEGRTAAARAMMAQAPPREERERLEELKRGYEHKLRVIGDELEPLLKQRDEAQEQVRELEASTLAAL